MIANAMQRIPTRSALVAALAVAGAPGIAAAHGPGGLFDPISMDRLTPASTLSLDFGFTVFDEPPETDVTAVGFTLAGHWVDERSGFGGYLALPLSYISIDTPIGDDDSELALGNIELGAMFAKFLSPNAALIAHLGVAVPTADDDQAGALQVLASSPRWGDLVMRRPNSTWLRLGVSPTGHVGKLFWRADLGIDLALDDDNAVDLSPVLRLNVGGGVDLGSAHLIAELVTNVVDDGSEDESTSTLALGARFVTGNLRPGIALLLPLGFPEGGFGFAPDFGLAITLAARL